MSQGQIKVIEKADEQQGVVRGPNRATMDSEEGVSLKERLDDALRRVASLQQDLKEIRREIVTAR